MALEEKFNSLDNSLDKLQNTLNTTKKVINQLVEIANDPRNIRFSDRELEVIDEMGIKTHKDRKQVIINALRIYRWLIDQKEKGFDVGSFKNKDDGSFEGYKITEI